MPIKNKQELVKQIEAYGLKHKLAEIARREEKRRPFRHLPKQFSKGILIGNIAIVPKNIQEQDTPMLLQTWLRRGYCMMI